MATDLERPLSGITVISLATVAHVSTLRLAITTDAP
jgi:hypothetical protein